MPTSGSSAHQRHARSSHSSSPSSATAAASPSHSRTRSPTNGRTIAPSLIQDPSTLQTLSSTLSVLSKHASSGLSSLSSAAALASARARGENSTAKASASASTPQHARHHQHSHSHSYSQPQQHPPHPSMSHSPPDLLGTSPSPIFNAMGGSHLGAAAPGDVAAEGSLRNDDDLVDSQLSGLDDILSSSERITFAAWDHMPLDGGLDALVLVVAYASGGLQIFAKQGSQFCEILNFQQVLLPGDRVAGRVLAAKVQRLQPEGRPHLLLVTEGQEQDSGSLVLARCSVDSQMVDDTAFVAVPSGTNQQQQQPTQQQFHPGVHQHASYGHAPYSAAAPSVSLQLSDRHLVVARSHPPAIHILDPVTFEAVQDAITDVASSSSSDIRPPPCHLSGRLLVYASTDSEVDPNVMTSAAAREGGRTSSTGSFAPGGGTAAGSGSSGVGIGVGAGGVAGDVFNAESVRLSAIEAGAHASDMAKRVGGGLMTGVRNLGDWGASYLAGHGHGTGASGARDVPHAKMSKSAPNASPALLSITSPTLSPALLPGGVESRQKRTTSLGSTHAEQQQQQLRPATAALIRVLDLKRRGKPYDQVVASFTAGAQSVACVKVDPSGSLILVADTLGHAFHVFEIRPRPSCLGAGAGASRATTSSTVAMPPALHRFKLLRGVTSAHVCDAKWSNDGQWVSVLTQNGTVHVYRLGPIHGPRASPLGSALRSFARTPRPRGRVEPQQAPSDAAHTHAHTIGGSATAAGEAPVPPAFTFGPADFNTSAATATMGLAASPPSTAGIDVLCLHPSIAAVTMSRVVTASASLSETVASSAAEATHRVSGLTAMMRRASVGPPAPRAPTSRTRQQHNTATTTPRRAVGEAVAVAIWSDLARQYDAPEVRPRSWQQAQAQTQTHSHSHSHTQSQQSAVAAARSIRWVSFAEVETYDRTPRALPTPLYLSHQFRFCVFVAPDADADASMRREPTLIDVPRCRTRRLHTRESVRVQRGHPGDGMDDVAGSATAAAAMAASSSSSFDTSLASAIAAVHFDPHSPSPEAEAFRARSPSSCIPSFPQGHSARRPSWRTSVTSGMSIPIRMGAAASRGVVAAGAGSFGRTGRGSAGSAGVGAHAVGGGLSFDEDASHDAFIFADARNAAPSPNGCAPSSVPSRVTSSTGSSASPGGGASGPGSADTAPTTLSDGEDADGDGYDEGSGDADADADADGSGSYSDEDEEESWAAARGLQEDVEGDALGWDSFADPEFGGGGAKVPRARGAGTTASASASASASKKARAAARRARMHDRREDFLVGGLALDEDAAAAGAGAGTGAGAAETGRTASGPAARAGSSASSGDSTATSTKTTTTAAAAAAVPLTPGTKLPPFSRKVNHALVPAAGAEAEAEGECSGPEGSKHTSTTAAAAASATEAAQQHKLAGASLQGARAVRKVKRK